MNTIFAPLVKIYKSLYLFAYDITDSYGFALILLSIATFIVLYPLNKKVQQIQSKEHMIQSVLAPQIEVIKKRYSGHKQYENIQWLYQRYGYHPLYAIRSALGFIFQIPFLTAAYYMLSGLLEIQGVPWGIIPNLGAPDSLLGGINILPFIMTLITIVYAFVMPEINKKERLQTVAIGIFFLLLLYSAPSALLIFWTCNLIWSLIDNVLSRKLEWLGDFILENELALHIIFSLSVTVGLFVPTEIYLKNANELWFSFKEILKFFIQDTALYFSVLFFVYVLCRRKTIKYAYLSILLGILLGAFLQSYVIGLNYGKFDGHEIEWDKYTKFGLANTVIWLTCIAEPFVRFWRLKFNVNKIKRFVKPITFCIVAIQCVVLLLTIKWNPLPEEAFHGKEFINQFTTKNMYIVSKQRNIIVFLLDAFDASIFETMMKQEPEIIEGLRGFTFYPDTTSVYGYTHNSLPQIVTGKTYFNDMPHADYLETAWADNPYYKYLEKQNYDVGIYTTEQIATKNAPITNLINGKVELNGKSLKDFKNLVLFRVFPHYAKSFFYKYNPNIWSQLFEDSNIQTYFENDRNFYLKLKQGLSSQVNNNCFRFYHLTGAHHPYVLDRNLEPVLPGVTGTQYDQAIGAMKIVLDYIKQMKDLKIFDDCTFVIMADHGWINKIGSRPLLCVKRQGKTDLDLKISDDPVSFSQFLPMILNVLDSGSKDHVLPSSIRTYYLQQERDFVEYLIEGNAKDISSWRRGRTLSSWYKRQSNQYTLGEIIDCSDKNMDFETFQVKGWYVKPHSTGTSTVGPEAELLLRVKDYKGQKLKYTFNAIAYLGDLPYRKLKIFANGKFITEFILDNKETNFSFNISPLENKNNLLRICFCIDNSDIALKSGLRNAWGIFMENFKIEAIDN